jgi:large subunit ribosomal protein L18
LKKNERRIRRKKGIRKSIYGSETKPRITVFRSNKHIYVQAIDDDKGSTLCSSSDVKAGVKKNCDGAIFLGQKLAQNLKEAKVKQVVFDRNGYIYHGIVKSIAEGIRKGGIRV